MPNNRMKHLILVLSIGIIGMIIVLCMLHSDKLFVKSNDRINWDSLSVCTTNYGRLLKTTGEKFPNLWIRNDSTIQLDRLPKPLLVFYISESHCTKCIEKELRLLDKCCKDISKNIIILASLHSIKDIGAFQQAYHIEYPTYLIARDSFEWEVNQLEKPYYFILDHNMKVSNLFISDEVYPDLSIQYLRGINELLTN